jgi:hypothetical protein
MPVVNDSTQDSMQDFYVGFEVFMAVTMKNIVFRDIKNKFVLHRRHITSALQSLAS